MFHRYRYESEYYAELNRIPLNLRMKLDLTGVKISLEEWLTLALPERRVLCHLPCDSAAELKAFVGYLNFLSHRYLNRALATTEPLDSARWDSPSVPPAVLARCPEERPIDVKEWLQWQSHQRYALFKTATSKSEPDAFTKLLTEFRAQRELRS